MASTYKTVSGDTWDLIAYNQLGAERYMKALMEANLPLTETLVFDGGTEIVIPDIPATDTGDLPFWRSDIDDNIWGTEV